MQLTKSVPSMPQIPVFTSASGDADPYGRRNPARAAQRGELTRIARGLYVPAEEWKSLKRWEQHLVLAHAVGQRGAGGVILSHESAAMVLGINLLGAAPAKVQAVASRGSGGAHAGSVRIRTTTSAVEPVEVGGAWVTPPARTVIDIAATHSFESALVAADSALRQRLVTLDELYAEMEHAAGRPGIRRVRAVIQRADGASGAASESLSRARMYQLGARIPVLQKRFFVAGTEYFVDFYWEDEDAIGECDGLMKYQTAAGVPNSRALISEKYREDELRARVRLFRRWGWDDAWRVTGLERVLRDVGALTGEARALFGLRR